MDKTQNKQTPCGHCLKMTFDAEMICSECGKEKHGCVSMSEARRLKIQKELRTGFNIKKDK